VVRAYEEVEGAVVRCLTVSSLQEYIETEPVFKCIYRLNQSSSRDGSWVILNKVYKGGRHLYFNGSLWEAMGGTGGSPPNFFYFTFFYEYLYIYIRETCECACLVCVCVCVCACQGNLVHGRDPRAARNHTNLLLLIRLVLKLLEGSFHRH